MYRWIREWVNTFGSAKLTEFQAGWGDWGTLGDSFVSGKTVFTYQGPWQHPIAMDLDPSLDLGAGVWPAAAGVDPTVWYNVDTVHIPVGTQHPQEALEFMAFFSTKEGQDAFNLGDKGAGRMSVARDYGGAEFIRQNRNPFIDKHYRALESGEYRVITPVSPADDAYASNLFSVTEAVLANPDIGDAELEKALRDAYKRVQDVVDSMVGER
jgi:ABC-type glycerol-3-phosphate transport system substrate-binding protein